MVIFTVYPDGEREHLSSSYFTFGCGLIRYQTSEYIKFPSVITWLISGVASPPAPTPRCFPQNIEESREWTSQANIKHWETLLTHTCIIFIKGRRRKSNTVHSFNTPLKTHHHHYEIPETMQYLHPFSNACTTDTPWPYITIICLAFTPSSLLCVSSFIAAARSGHNTPSGGESLFREEWGPPALRNSQWQ